MLHRTHYPMKLSLLTACAMLTVACGSSGGAAPDDFAAPGDENDLTKTAKVFTCNGDWSVRRTCARTTRAAAGLVTKNADLTGGYFA